MLLEKSEMQSTRVRAHQYASKYIYIRIQTAPTDAKTYLSVIVLDARHPAHVHRQRWHRQHRADLERALHDLHPHHYWVFLVKDVLGEDLQYAWESGDLDGFGSSGWGGGVVG